MRKGNACAFAYLLCIFFLALVFTASASRRAPPVKMQQGEQKIMPNGIQPNKGVVDDFSNVMGMDMVECGEGDEDCNTRRMMADAHLDYIYTQSQNPS